MRSGDDPALSELAREGEKIYQSVCIACHNGNPNLDGALGPANAGASAELLAAKVLRGEYPPGYAPKRPGSHTMPRFEYLADKIPALAAYLAEVEDYAGIEANAGDRRGAVRAEHAARARARFEARAVGERDLHADERVAVAARRRTRSGRRAAARSRIDRRRAEAGVRADRSSAPRASPGRGPRARHP